jgi:hypothetical protein
MGDGLRERVILFKRSVGDSINHFLLIDKEKRIKNR